MHAAEGFINFLSKPENAVRNMDYIGYTSVISGGDSPVVYDYIKWNYGAEDGGEDTVTYPLGYFFSGDTEDKKYMLTDTAALPPRPFPAPPPPPAPPPGHELF